MADLDVYLGSELVGQLRGEADAVMFTYTESWLADGVAISHRLPLRSGPADAQASRVFFDGLLPEATLRTELARIWRCDPLDTYALLAAIGRESAGAISVLPAGEPLPPRGKVDWCTEDELAVQLARLPTAPLASVPGSGVRVSLGGAQDKLVLVREGSRWGLPHPGSPSTHIAKPDPQRDWLPHLAVNEFVCCRWIAHLGLPVAATELIKVGDRRVLISTRFDRTGSHPNVTRLHQEDFAQITGHLALQKYEENGGPSIADCLAAISEVSADPLTDRRSFVNYVWTNALLGNADAHAKNYAMLLKGRTWHLAPMYDVNCTLVYEEVDHGLAMRLDGKDTGRSPDPDHLSPNALEHALTTWGYTTVRGRRNIASRMVDLADRVIDTTSHDIVPDEIQLIEDEQRHVRLMTRDIHRRAGNLRKTASALTAQPSPLRRRQRLARHGPPAQG